MQVLSTVTVGNSRGDSKGEGGSSAVPGSRRQLAAFVAESLKSNSVTVSIDLSWQSDWQGRSTHLHSYVVYTTED